MNFLRTHKIWLGMLMLALAIIAGRDPVLQFAGGRVAQDLATVQADRAKTENDLKQVRDDVASARKLGSEIDRAHAIQILAPADRLKAATMLEREAAAAKILRFTYTLAPEERLAMAAGGSMQNLALSPVALSGDAPDDLQIYAFITSVQRLLPGRARLQQLTISRSGNADAPLTGINVHFEATLEWLSNGTLQTVAGRL